MTSGGVSRGSRSVWCTGIRRLRTCGRGGILGSATVSSLLLRGRLKACLLGCCALCFAFYCLFFVWDCPGNDKKRKEACMDMHVSDHFHLQSKEPRSNEMSTPVLGATLEVQNTIRLRGLGLP